MSRTHRLGELAVMPPRTGTVAAALVTVLLVTALAAPPAHAATVTFAVAPTGDDANPGTPDRPVATPARAQQLARARSATDDVVVQLAGGTYRLSAPLTFTSADSAQNGHTVTWRAAAGQTPVLSGGSQVTGWTVRDAGRNIWVASVPPGADSRQLFVDGTPAPRAAVPISRGDVQITTAGLTIVNSALNYLATLPQQNRIEVESQNSFTDRYSPVDHVSGTSVVMQQPAWNNNNWGYDTLAKPFGGGRLYLENSYTFLKNAGQWYLDTQAGKLFYKAPGGWVPSGHDVELPRLTSLLRISGSYDN
ncbi:MAG TPA: right-handed parallel beta-helix repeat-containing protein, partial [Streptomyces sp.]